MVASPTDDPGALGAIEETLSGNVNDGRTMGTNSPFVRVTSEATSTGQSGGLALGLPTLISTTDGSATVTVEIESPLWAEFDTIEYYVNNVPAPDDYDADPSTPPFYRVTPDVVHTAGVDFTITTVDDYPLIPGAGHLEATDSLSLTGLTEDTWVVVLVRGTDGVSKPIFPVVPNDLDETTNTTLADLTDGNLGELGVPATAFANPLFIDVDGNALYDPPWTAACASGVAIDNGPVIAGDDDTLPALLSGARVPDACDSDDDNDGLPDVDEDPLANCGIFNGTPAGHPNPARGDITNDDDHDGNPASPMGTDGDGSDDGPSWDTDNDGFLDGFECASGHNPRNGADYPTTTQCGGTVDDDGDGLPNAWESCKWGTDKTLTDSDSDGIGDCKEAADVNGDDVVNFVGDTIYYAKALFLPTASYGKTMDFDINGDGVLDYVGDVIQEAKFALITGLCN